MRALPALIDDLAVVYNKKLFKQLGVSEPPAGGWTWDQFAATAKQLTDKGKGTFGTAGRRSATRTRCGARGRCVWQAGGDIIKDGKAAFGGAPGEQAFGVVDRLAQDGSVYVDTKPDSDQTYQLFNNDKIGMVVTGPWQLPDFIEAKTSFGVAPLPTFGGEPLTISAPDTWTLFDNGKRRAKAAVEFVQWLNSPAQDARWVVDAGSLPLRKGTAPAAAVEGLPGQDAGPAGVRGRARRRAHEADRPARTRRSPSRSGSRSSRCCSSAPRRRTRSTRRSRAATRSSPAEADRRVAVAVERAPSRTQRVFGETPTAWLWVDAGAS